MYRNVKQLKNNEEHKVKFLIFASKIYLLKPLTIFII